MSDQPNEYPEHIARAIELYRSGTKLEHITRSTGITNQLLYEWLDKTGVPRRRPNNRRKSSRLRQTVLEEFFKSGMTRAQGVQWAHTRYGLSRRTFYMWTAQAFSPLIERPFSPFKALIFPRMENAPHLALLDRHLESVHTFTTSGGKQGIGCLIVSMPPRHAKSLTISRLFPAWHMGRAPDQRVILASYAANLALKHSRLIRNTMRSPMYQTWSNGVRPAASHEGSASVESWDLMLHNALTGGGLDAVGVGGGITGKGAHLIIIDDPVKSRQEAESEHMRERVWDWFLNDLWTRREPGAAVVVVMTRWHVDDLVGRLLREMPGVWTNLSLPAFAVADDPLGREPGAALWEARFPREALDSIRQTIGAYAFAGLYQQNPIPAEGNFFDVEKLHVIDSLPVSDPVIARARFWDLGMSERADADYSAGVLMGRTQAERYVILDVIRVQRRTSAMAALVIETGLIDGADVMIGIENAAGGRFVVEEALAALVHHSVQRIDVSGKKIVRAMPFASRVNESRIAIMDCPLARTLKEEMRLFPTGSHDDLVDAASGAFQMLNEQAGLLVDWANVL